MECDYCVSVFIGFVSLNLICPNACCLQTVSVALKWFYSELETFYNMKLLNENYSVNLHF